MALRYDACCMYHPLQPFVLNGTELIFQEVIDSNALDYFQYSQLLHKLNLKAFSLADSVYWYWCVERKTEPRHLMYKKSHVVHSKLIGIHIA